MAFSPDGSTLASVTGGGAGQRIAWDVARGQARKALGLDGRGAVAVSADNRTVAVFTGAQVQVWDLAAGSILWNRPLPGPIAFSPDAQELVTSAPQAGTLLFWTAPRAQPIRPIPTRHGRIAAPALPPA